MPLAPRRHLARGNSALKRPLIATEAKCCTLNRRTSSTAKNAKRRSRNRNGARLCAEHQPQRAADTLRLGLRPQPRSGNFIAACEQFRPFQCRARKGKPMKDLQSLCAQVRQTAYDIHRCLCVLGVLCGLQRRPQDRRHPGLLECAGKAQRRRRFDCAGTAGRASQSGVALRLPPHSKTAGAATESSPSHGHPTVPLSNRRRILSCTLGSGERFNSLEPIFNSVSLICQPSEEMNTVPINHSPPPATACRHHRPANRSTFPDPDYDSIDDHSEGPVFLGSATAT